MSIIDRQLVPLIRIGLALLLMGLMLSAAALDIDPRLARMRRLDSTDGLSQNSVLSMAQDRHGFMWFGTQDGLNRYDGQDLRIYQARRERDDALNSSWITALVVDPEGDLWVGTQAGLHRYIAEQDAFERFLPDPQQPGSIGGQVIYALTIDSRGSLWIGSDGGLSQWMPSQQGFRNWQQLPGEAAVLPDNRIRSLAIAADGMVWVGTVAGLARFDPSAGRFLPAPAQPPLTPQPINALLADREGRIWVGSDHAGLLRFDPGQQTWLQATAVENDPDALPHTRVHALREDADGAIWVGTELGVSRVRRPADAALRFANYWHRRHDPNSLGAGRVPSLMQDRDGTLWIGTWETGASRLSPYYSRLHSFSADTPVTDGMRSPTVRALAADQGALWLGTRDGLYRLDVVDLHLEILPAVGLEVYGMSLHAGRLGISSGNGLRVLLPATRELQAPTLPDELNNARLRRIFLDEQRTWVAAELLGLYVFGDDLQRPLHRYRFDGNLYKIQRYDEATVLVSASDGLYWYSRDGSRLLHHHRVGGDGASGSLPAPPTGFDRSPDGRLWLGTYGAGLLSMQFGVEGDLASLRFVDVTAGLDIANLGINDTLADQSSRLWLATDRGISRVDPADWSVRNFDRSDGALTRGYYFEAAAVLPNGWMAFGSKDGLTLFDPDVEETGLALPPPLLTELESDNRAVALHGRDPGSPLQRPVYLSERLDLPAGWGRSLSLHFASPSFLAPERLRYRYRLDGFDDDWVQNESGSRQASFTNLAPGRYRFRVIAVGPQGRRSEETRLDLTIAPWWWQSRWAQGVAAALFLGLLFSIHLLRLQRIRAQKRGLERQVAERTEALAVSRDRAEAALDRLRATQEELVQSEKLAALGQLVAGVAHEVNTPLGVALTATSHLHDAITTVSKQLQAASLRRADLEAFIEQADEASVMIERNLDRAADLIRSFKQVSVDRSSDGRRHFNLAAFFDELLQSLKLLWKHSPLHMQIDCPGDLEIDSFPGALGQVVTNLAQNAIIHAFEPGQPGRMRIVLQALGSERIELRFSDNGRGIPAEHLERIFEPFFTTRRSQGGTGLGLNIVFNLVVQKLGGSIRVESTLGSGTEFTIVLPTTAP